MHEKETPQAPLTVTWSTTYIDPRYGRECALTIGNGDSRTVLAKAQDAMEWLDSIGAQPVFTAPSAPLAGPPAPLAALEEGQGRLLITKVKRTGAARADLFAKGHRYKTTTLFDLGDLLAVGTDPELPEGVETPVRFYAVVVESDKLNKAGNPYLDVIRLERAQ